MDMNFLKLIFVGEGSAGHVDMVAGVIIYCKYYAVSCIAYWTAHLKQKQKLHVSSTAWRITTAAALQKCLFIIINKKEN